MNFLDCILEVPWKRNPAAKRVVPSDRLGFSSMVSPREMGNPLLAGEPKAVKNSKEILGLAPLVLHLRDPQVWFPRDISVG